MMMLQRGQLWIVAFTALFLALVGARRASAESTPSRELAKAWAEYYIEHRDYKSAIRQLNSHLSKDPADPEALKLLGVAYRLTGSWGEAETALQRSAERLSGVDRAVVLYLVADSQIQAGLVSRAKSTLERVAELPELAESAKSASSVAVAGVALPPLDLDRSMMDARFEAKRPWTLGVNVSSAYDTNVLLLPDSQTAGQNPATSMITTGVQAGYSRRISRWNFSSNLSASYTKNFNPAAASFDNVPVSLGLEWGLPGVWASEHGIALTQSASATYVKTTGMNLFSTSAGAGVKGNILDRWGHLLEVALPVSHNWYPGVPVTSAADDRTGFGISPSLSYRHSVLGLPVFETLSYARQFAKGPNFISATYSALAGLTFNLPAQVGANLSLSASRGTYPQNSTGRADTRYNAGLEFSRRFHSFVPLSGSLSYGVEKNSSTIVTASYFKHSAILKVNYEVQ